METSTIQTKKWWQSKTIWGTLIASLGFVLSYVLKVDIQLPQDATFDDIQGYIKAIKDANGSMEVLLPQVMMAFGTIWAFIGRVKAETKVTM